MSVPSPANGIARWGSCCVLPENRSAVEAVAALGQALAAGRRPPANPLMLHGAAGVGKSHLAATLIQQLSQSATVITSRTVAVGDLAREADTEAPGFADRELVDCDLLVLEDVQLLPPRHAGAVAALIDKRLSRRKATIATASVGPAKLKQFPRKLTSRLAGGLVVHLEPLSPPSRRNFLEAAAEERNLRLTPDALDWLAGQTKGGGIRQLLGLLGNIAAGASHFPPPLDRTAVQTILTGAGLPAAEHSDVARIVRQVAAAYGVTRKELLGPSRLRRVLVPRQVAMYLARELSGLSLPRLGSAFGGRDHTTVLHACRRVQAEAETDATLAGMVKQLRAELA
ncbi:MAG TPA: helix-turn-helix domain-containing protein [Gemmataceae bacterium]